MAVAGTAGPDYSIYTATNLNSSNWTLLLTTNPPSLPFVFSDSTATNPGQPILDELARLREIVGKLPKTADGVPVTLGDAAFYPFNFYGEPALPQTGTVVMADDDCAKYKVQLMLAGHNPAIETLAYKSVAECYSTREAAEAAEGEQH